MVASQRGLTCIVWVLLVLAAMQPQLALGHGVPIDIVAIDGKLTPFLVDSLPAEIASLQKDSDTGLVVATSPGFGVTNNANRIASGSPLGLNVVSMLGYWDGTQLRKPDAALKIEPPSGFQRYVVRANTGDLTGMGLGSFQGFPFWEADSSYTLVPSDSEVGLYGFMAQVTSPDYVDSDPFLFPLVYDPEITLGPIGFKNGVSALRGLFGKNSYDVNQDGLLNSSDVDEICGAVGSNNTGFDFNTDGLVNVSDVETWLDANFTSNGDANLDGEVAFSDFLTLTAGFASNDADSSMWSDGDFNCDQSVNFPDFLILTSNFGSIGRTLPANSIESVPEPSLNMWTTIFSLLTLSFTNRNCLAQSRSLPNTETFAPTNLQ